MIDNLILDVSSTSKEMELDIETTHKSLSLELQSSQGTTDYGLLRNKPRIENVELEGDKTFVELGLGEITPQDIDEIIFGKE